MRTVIGVLVFVAMCYSLQAQTIIEMMHPDDADASLLVVNKIEDADIVIFKTNKKDEYSQFDCMWRFRKGGFANYHVYLTYNAADSLLLDNDEGVKRLLDGKVYFTDNAEERGYKNPNFRLPGLLRVTGRVEDKDKNKKSNLVFMTYQGVCVFYTDSLLFIDEYGGIS